MEKEKCINTHVSGESSSLNLKKRKYPLKIKKLNIQLFSLEGIHFSPSCFTQFAFLMSGKHHQRGPFINFFFNYVAVVSLLLLTLLLKLISYKL